MFGGCWDSVTTYTSAYDPTSILPTWPYADCLSCEVALFVGVLKRIALLRGVCIEAADCWKLPGAGDSGRYGSGTVDDINTA